MSLVGNTREICCSYQTVIKSIKNGVLKEWSILCYTVHTVCSMHILSVEYEFCLVIGVVTFTFTVLAVSEEKARK